MLIVGPGFSLVSLELGYDRRDIQFVNCKGCGKFVPVVSYQQTSLVGIGVNIGFNGIYLLGIGLIKRYTLAIIIVRMNINTGLSH